VNQFKKGSGKMAGETLLGHVIVLGAGFTMKCSYIVLWGCVSRKFNCRNDEI
jgi:hypothetical protein